MIRDCKLWNLYLAPDSDSIDVMAYCPLDEHPLLVDKINIDTSSTSRVMAIEEAIYDNPLLLNEFKRVTIVSRTDLYAIIPTPISADPDLTNSILTEMTGVSSSTLITDSLPLLDSSLCHLMDSDLYNFFNRTFSNNVRFTHRLSALTRYYHGCHRSTGSLISHVNLRRSSFDIVLYNGDRLLLANTYRWENPVDALYYIIATRQVHGIDNNAAVILSGERDVREELTPLLKQHIPTVMPAIFPAAMFRAGGQVAMNAPTDLIVLPLCE